MGWEECVLLRKEKWSVCSGKHRCIALPVQPGFDWKEREGPSRELGEMFHASDTFVDVYHIVTSGYVTWALAAKNHFADRKSVV